MTCGEECEEACSVVGERLISAGSTEATVCGAGDLLTEDWLDIRAARSSYITTTTMSIISDPTDHYLSLMFRSLPETFIRRSLFNSSSGSCISRAVTWQEISRTCGWVSSYPRRNSSVVDLISKYILLLWSILCFCPIPCPGRDRCWRLVVTNANS